MKPLKEIGISLMLVSSLLPGFVHALIDNSMRFFRLTIVGGLSLSTVDGIVRDARDFLRFSSEDGPKRNDGFLSAVVMHKSGNPEPLSENSTCLMPEDRERNRKLPAKWEMRAGLHLGSVIAEVVGRRKFAYDLKADTVIPASRMGISKVEERVNVSALPMIWL